MKKGIFSKLVVAFIIIANTLFTMAALYIFRQTESEPVVLIGAWFAFTTGELWFSTQIKKEKERSKNDKLETEAYK